MSIVPTTTGIKVKSNGRLETISPAEFQQRYGVEYTSTLRFAEGMASQESFELETTESQPEESQRHYVEQQFARWLRSVGDDRLEKQPLKRRLFAEKVLAGQTADLYLSKIDDQVGHGVFAASDIMPGELIGEYTGLVRRREEGDIANVYLFNYTDGTKVDARDLGNLTRFINHSSLHTNSSFAYMIVDGIWHIIIVATAAISRGRQVLYNYGPYYWRNRTPSEFDPDQLDIF